MVSQADLYKPLDRPSRATLAAIVKLHETGMGPGGHQREAPRTVAPTKVVYIVQLAVLFRPLCSDR